MFIEKYVCNYNCVYDVSMDQVTWVWIGAWGFIFAQGQP